MSIPRYFLFLCGQIGIMSLSRFLYQWIITYGALDDSETKLFPAITLGIVFFSFRVFDGITDPVAGKLTDSWARKGFQRRTLLWVSFSLAPIGLTLTFLANHSHSKPFAWALLTLGLLIFFIGYTFYAIPYWSLIDDYAQGDMKVRAKLSNLLGLGIVLASGIGFVASGALIEKLSGLPEPELIWEGGEFTEGPAVGPDGSVLFSDVGADSIYKFSPANKKVTTFRERSGRANGLIFDPDGNLIACEGANTGGGRRIS
ncbi:MAG: MFS transporter, partial [Verrucomicrobiales bacterium]|nr:MFS transporter [Verrucomicrobiales bacterium]